MPSIQTPNVPARSDVRQRMPLTRRIVATAALCGICWTLPGCGKSESTQTTPTVPTAGPAAADEIQTVTRLMTGITGNDPAAFSAVDPDHFIQHDLSIGEGLLGLKDYAASLQASPIKLTPVRMFRDGDTVVVQSSIDSATPQVAIDVYRFDHGKIVEHWDNIQDRFPTANPSGHTQTDGNTAVAATGDVTANEALAKRFINDVLIGGKLDGFDAFFDGDKYVQHDPYANDGAGTLKSALAGLAASNQQVGYSKVFRVLGKGDLVLVMSSGIRFEKPTAFFDLFRIENGKLAEHWSTVQAIPPREAWKNSNGKF